MKGSSRSYSSLGLESVCVLVYVSVTSFIAMSIKHKGDRESVCVWRGDLVVCLSPPHHVAPETGARFRTHTHFFSNHRGEQLGSVFR